MRKLWLVAGAVAALAGVAAAQPNAPQVVTPPKASYWVSATTGSGLMGLTAPQQSGARPSMRDSMRMAQQMASGGGVSHQLKLDLGSTLAPTGATKAEHTPPPGLGVRGVLPLETPRPSTPGAPQQRQPNQPEQPKGRMLIFWGCGEHVRAGQPVVIDVARMAQGQWPPGMSSVSVNAPNPPSRTSHRTFGDWPNAIRPNGDANIPGTGSLLGEHVVRGTYTPDIRFTATQDFMAPVSFTTNAKAPSGAVNLVWNSIPGATGYAGYSFGAKGDDMVFWSTSEVKAFGVFQDYIPPSEAARLVRERALLAPTATQCTVPVEVMAAMGGGGPPTAQQPGAGPSGGMLFFTAFGPEQNIIHPERPTDPRTPWNQEYFVKIRHKSASLEMLGSSMSAMMAGANGQPQMTPEERCRAMREAQGQQSGAVGSAIGSATGIPGAGMIGGMIGRARAKQKDQPADPNCPS